MIAAQSNWHDHGTTALPLTCCIRQFYLPLIAIAIIVQQLKYRVIL